MKQELDQTLPNIPQENVKVADDTTSFVKNLTPEITNKLLCLYNKLNILTGLQINPSKSTYFTIGPEPSPEFVAGLTIASLDMFTKIQLVQTSIMSKPLHCYWVFAPSKQMQIPCGTFFNRHCGLGRLMKNLSNAQKLRLKDSHIRCRMEDWEFYMFKQKLHSA